SRPRAWTGQEWTLPPVGLLTSDGNSPHSRQAARRLPQLQSLHNARHHSFRTEARLTSSALVRSFAQRPEDVGKRFLAPAQILHELVRASLFVEMDRSTPFGGRVADPLR